MNDVVINRYRTVVGTVLYEDAGSCGVGDGVPCNNSSSGRATVYPTKVASYFHSPYSTADRISADGDIVVTLTNVNGSSVTIECATVVADIQVRCLRSNE